MDRTSVRVSLPAGINSTVNVKSRDHAVHMYYNQIRGKSMLVLGLDVSMTNTGWVIVRADSTDHLWLKDCGVIQTEKLSSTEKVSGTVDSIRRAAHIASELQKAIKGHEITLVCVESMSWPRNAASSIKMAMAWGAIAELLVSRPLIEVGPQEIKKVVAGSRSATKQEVEAAVRKNLSHSHLSASLLEKQIPRKALREHCWDALGSILTSQKTERWKLVRAGYWRVQ